MRGMAPRLRPSAGVRAAAARCGPCAHPVQQLEGVGRAVDVHDLQPLHVVGLGGLFGGGWRRRGGVCMRVRSCAMRVCDAPSVRVASACVDACVGARRLCACLRGFQGLRSNAEPPPPTPPAHAPLTWIVLNNMPRPARSKIDQPKPCDMNTNMTLPPGFL